MIFTLGGMIRLIMEVPALRDYSDEHCDTPRGRGRRYAPASRVKALDELLDFPHLNVLFRLVLTHFFLADARPLDTSVLS